MLLKSVNLAHFEIYGEESDRRIDFKGNNRDRLHFLV